VIDRIRRYLAESYSELKKVTWPTREHVRNLTILVFVISGIFGVYIGFFDLIWQQVFAFITRTFG
jgi:preprotein translocase SecE subunit